MTAFLEERHTMSQQGVLLNKIQIAIYSIRHNVNVLKPNIKICCRLICTDKFGAYYFRGLDIFKARDIFFHHRTINRIFRSLKL